MPQVKYTLAERAFLYDTYVKTDSIFETRKLFRKKFPNSEVPHRSSVRRLIKKVRDNGTLLDIKPKHKRYVLTDEILEEINEKLEQTPTKSSRIIAQETGVSVASAKTAKKLLKLKRYKKTVTEELNDLFSKGNPSLDDVLAHLRKRYPDFSHEKSTICKLIHEARKRKEAAVDPLSTDEVFTVKEPVDVNTSSNVPDFEVFPLPGCSAWTAVTEDSATTNDTLVSDVPKPTEKICRLCMSSEDLIGIYDPASVLQDLSSKIIEVCAIPIHQGDGLPQYICQTCMTTVQKFYDFRLQCSVTDVTLKAEHTNTVLASTKKKRKGDSSEFQKLNKRLKANIQSFYNLINSINEFQDKVQHQFEDTSTSSKIPMISETRGAKRKAKKRLQKGGKTAKFTRKLTPVEFTRPQTLPDQTLGTQISDSDGSSSFIMSIKSDPEDSIQEPYVESVFVSCFGGDTCAMTDPCETKPFESNTLGELGLTGESNMESELQSCTALGADIKTEKSVKERASNQNIT